MAWNLISLPHRMRSIAEVSTLVVCLYLQISTMNSTHLLWFIHSNMAAEPFPSHLPSSKSPSEAHTGVTVGAVYKASKSTKVTTSGFASWGKSCMLMVLKSHQAVSKLPGLPPLLMMLQLQFTLIILQIHISCKHESLWCAYKCAQHTSNNRNLATLVASYWRSLFFLVFLKHVPIPVIQALFKDTCVIIELSRVLVTSAELWTVHAANKGGVALSAAQWKRLGKQVKISST